MTKEKLYGERDVIKQGEWFSKHLMHMTSEGLHDKSAIAAELAHRDIIIDKLVNALNKCTEAIESYEMTELGAAAHRFARVTLDIIFDDSIEIDL